MMVLSARLALVLVVVVVLVVLLLVVGVRCVNIFTAHPQTSTCLNTIWFVVVVVFIEGARRQRIAWLMNWRAAMPWQQYVLY